jgi:hypothetical protein
MFAVPRPVYADPSGPIRTEVESPVRRHAGYPEIDQGNILEELDVWQEPYVTLRLPMLYNLLMDPFERAEESEDYPRWRIDNAWAFVPAQAIVAQFLQSFRDFPPRAKPGSFSLDQALQKMQQPSNN